MHRIFGRGPATIELSGNESIISNYYKYDSSSRSFQALPAVRAMTSTTDAVSVDPSKIKRK